MRRLIFGCGYLGRRVATAWRNAGDEVFAVTRSQDKARRISESGIQPIIGDVTEPDTLKNLPDSQTVLHAVGFDRTAGPDKREVYVDGLRHVLHAIDGRCERLIQISSTSVYGQRDGEEVDEKSPAEPEHESGLICRDAEQLVFGFAGENPAGMAESPRSHRATILRLSGIYGPGRLLSRVESIREGLKLPGPADSWLNLIHVDDAAHVVLAAADAEEVSNLYLVSDNQPILRRDYYETLARLIQGPPPEFDPDTVARHTRGRGKRCRNRRMKDELDITLRFPSIVTGLPQALS